MNQEFHYTWWHVYLVCGCLELSEVLSRPPNGPFFHFCGFRFHTHLLLDTKTEALSFIHIYIFFIIYLNMYIYIEREVTGDPSCMPGAMYAFVFNWTPSLETRTEMLGLC